MPSFTIFLLYREHRPLIRPNKKKPVSRVNRPYLNLLVKHRIVLDFLENIYNFMHFDFRNAFQNA